MKLYMIYSAALKANTQVCLFSQICYQDHTHAQVPPQNAARQPPGFPPTYS